MQEFQTKDKNKAMKTFHQTQAVRRNNMSEAMEITEKRLAVYEKEADLPDFELGNSKLGIGVIMIMTALVGIWGVACLISGLTNSASLHEMGRGVITAFTGM
jgi:hypothetical protein